MIDISKRIFEQLVIDDIRSLAVSSSEWLECGRIYLRSYHLPQWTGARATERVAIRAMTYEEAAGGDGPLRLILRSGVSMDEANRVISYVDHYVPIFYKSHYVETSVYRRGANRKLLSELFDGEYTSEEIFASPTACRLLHVICRKTFKEHRNLTVVAVRLSTNKVRVGVVLSYKVDHTSFRETRHSFIAVKECEPGIKNILEVCQKMAGVVELYTEGK